MADAFVTENDVVLVQPADDIGDGELVAVRRNLAGPIVLRRVSFEGDHAVLRAVDRRRHPTVLHRSRLDVCGRVVAIVRSDVGAA
jgi:SOS-response transcriptional repressor LexA